MLDTTGRERTKSSQGRGRRHRQIEITKEISLGSWNRAFHRATGNILHSTEARAESCNEVRVEEMANKWMGFQKRQHWDKRISSDLSD